MSIPAPAGVLTIDVADKRFGALGRAGERRVLWNVRLDVEPGTTVAVSGASGCGKTTLLNIVAGLDHDYSGGIDLAGGRLAYVFQEPRLLPWRTVRENVELVLEVEEDAPSRAAAALAEVGLEPAAETFASRLSLGMARRAALARALAFRPTLLLLDEPFVSLDEPTARRLRLLLMDLLARHRLTALLVTHHLDEAVTLADRLVVLAGQPATVTADIVIGLDRAARRDPDQVAAFRRSLVARRPELDAALGGEPAEKEHVQ